MIRKYKDYINHTKAIIVFLILLFSFLSPSLENSIVYSDNQNLYPKIIKIKILRNNEVTSLATGFFISPNTVVTNFHVIANFKPPVNESLFFSNTNTGGGFLPFSEIIALDAQNDLAILKTKDYHSEFFYDINKTENDSSQNTNKIYSPGFLGGDFYLIKATLKKNRLHFYFQDDLEENLMLIAHNTNHYGLKNGASGSPIFSDDHQILGILVGSDTSNTIYFTPIDKLIQLSSQSPLSCVRRVCIDLEKEKLRTSAEHGEALAQFRLGLMFEHGDGAFSKDPQQATYWYDKSSKQDFIQAHLNLGLMYLLSNHYNSTQKALERLYTASKKGNKIATHTLGLIYYYGDGVDVNFTKSFEYWASNKEYSDSQFSLGVLYERGLGTSIDFKKAIQFYTLSADQGHPQAKYNLALMYYYGRGVDPNVNKAIEWWIEASSAGDPKAPYQLGKIYYEGIKEVEKDLNKAKEWLNVASDRGNIQAQYLLGRIYEEKGNIEQAQIFYQKVAQAGLHLGAIALHKLSKTNN